MSGKSVGVMQSGAGMQGLGKVSAESNKADAQAHLRLSAQVDCFVIYRSRCD